MLLMLSLEVVWKMTNLNPHLNLVVATTPLLVIVWNVLLLLYYEIQFTVFGLWSETGLIPRNPASQALTAQ